MSARRKTAPSQSDGESDDHEHGSFPHHEAEDPLGVAAECHADAELPRALRHLIREHAVDADCGQHQRHDGKRHREQHAACVVD